MKSKKWRLYVAAMALFFALKWWFAAPSEDEMKRRFVEHRADFEQLRTMFQHDAPQSNLHLGDFAQSNDGFILPSGRFDSYQKLMRELGVLRVDGNANHFRMSVFWGGLGDTRWNIGYAFSSRKPNSIVPSAYFQKGYSSLSDTWYLYQNR